MNKYYDFLNKSHNSIEEVYEDFYNIDMFLTEEDEEPDSKSELPENPNTNETDEDNNKDKTLKDPSNTDDEKTKDNSDSEEEEFSFGEDDLDDSSSNEDDEQIMEEKQKFVSSIKQLVKIKSMLDSLINKTNDNFFSKIRFHIIKILSGIASEGKDIMTRDDLTDINNELEDFIKYCIIVINERLKRNYNLTKDEDNDEEGGEPLNVSNTRSDSSPGKTGN